MVLVPGTLLDTTIIIISHIVQAMDGESMLGAARSKLARSDSEVAPDRACLCQKKKAIIVHNEPRLRRSGPFYFPLGVGQLGGHEERSLLRVALSLHARERAALLERPAVLVKQRGVRVPSSAVGVIF